MPERKQNQKPKQDVNAIVSAVVTAMTDSAPVKGEDLISDPEAAFAKAGN
jgi:hypothetical protein